MNEWITKPRRSLCDPSISSVNIPIHFKFLAGHFSRAEQTRTLSSTSFWLTSTSNSSKYAKHPLLRPLTPSPRQKPYNLSSKFSKALPASSSLYYARLITHVCAILIRKCMTPRCLWEGSGWQHIYQPLTAGWNHNSKFKKNSSKLSKASITILANSNGLWVLIKVDKMTKKICKQRKAPQTKNIRRRWCEKNGHRCQEAPRLWGSLFTTVSIQGFRVRTPSRYPVRLAHRKLCCKDKMTL